MSASAELASRLVKRSAGRFELRPEPHRFAAFHVLRRAGAPAVLFEAGYISNADDELLLQRIPSTVPTSSWLWRRRSRPTSHPAPFAEPQLSAAIRTG